jgi:phosphate uptake regulator
MNYRDIEINRIHWLISRQCNMAIKDTAVSRKMSASPYELVSCLQLSGVLERIGDYAISVSNYLLIISESKSFCSVGEDIHALGMGVVDLLTRSIESWINKDMAMAEQVIKEADEIVQKVVNNVESNVKAHNVPEYVREVVLFSLKRVAEGCKDISDLTFNMAMD